jgi:predicted CoA-binding protein
LEAAEKKQERLEANIQQNDYRVNALKEALKNQEILGENYAHRLKEMGESIYKIDNVQFPAINTRLGQMASKDELTGLRNQMNSQVDKFYFFLSSALATKTRFRCMHLSFILKIVK